MTDADDSPSGTPRRWERIGMPSRRLLVGMALVSLLLMVVGGALAQALTLRSTTAEVRLVVGDQTLTAQAVPGYSDATVTLAETYARFVDGSSSGALGAEVTEVKATVIPENPVIRLQVTATGRAAALKGAKAAASELTRSVTSVTTNDIDGARTSFLRSQSRLEQAEAREAQLKLDLEQSLQPDRALERQVRSAGANVRLRSLEAEAAGAVLQTRLSASANRDTSVSVIREPQVVEEGPRGATVGALSGLGVAILGWTAIVVLAQARRRADGPE